MLTCGCRCLPAVHGLPGQHRVQVGHRDRGVSGQSCNLQESGRICWFLKSHPNTPLPESPPVTPWGLCLAGQQKMSSSNISSSQPNTRRERMGAQWFHPQADTAWAAHRSGSCSSFPLHRSHTCAGFLGSLMSSRPQRIKPPGKFSLWPERREVQPEARGAVVWLIVMTTAG